MDERVSYILFGPNSYGTISGSAPSDVPFTINSATNYLWVPTPQPQVSPTMEAIAKQNAAKELDADTRARTDNKTGFLSVLSKPLHYGGLLLTMLPNLTTNLGNGMMRLANWMDNYQDVPNYISPIADLDYIIELLERRWDNRDEWRSDISESATIALQRLSDLREMMVGGQTEVDNFRSSLPVPVVRTMKGKTHLVYGSTELERQSLEDRYKNLRISPLERGKGVLGKSRDSSFDVRRF